MTDDRALDEDEAYILLREIGGVLAGLDIGDTAASLTCTEAEICADVLRFTHDEDTAQSFLDHHSLGDDDPADQHYGRTTHAR